MSLNFRPPAIDNIRAGLLGISGTFWPLLNVLNITNFDDGQLFAIDAFTLAVVTFGLLFYNPQRDG